MGGSALDEVMSLLPKVKGLGSGKDAAPDDGEVGAGMTRGRLRLDSVSSLRVPFSAASLGLACGVPGCLLSLAADAPDGADGPCSFASAAKYFASGSVLYF